MKTRPAARLVVFAGIVLAAAQAAAPVPPPKPSAANPLSQRFKQVRERIDALYAHRSGLPEPFDPRHNPFRTPGTATGPVASLPGSGDVKSPPTALTAENNLSILQQAVAQLKVSGVFEIAGRSHLVINARPYKEGDAVQTTVGGETVYLRVREIQKRGVVLVLNDAEMKLNF